MSDFDDLARDIVDASKATVKKAGQALQQAAIRTKESWAGDVEGIPGHASQPGKSSRSERYAASIDYEINYANAGIFANQTYSALIGPDLGRYGGKGGPEPSAGIFDDPERSPIRAEPTRSRRRAEKFARAELEKGVQIAVDQTLREFGL